MARAPISRLTALFTPPPPIFLLTSLLALFALGFCSRQADATIYYVSTTGTGNGSSWATAGPLQTIITAAHAGDQVWVKKGTYTGNFTATDGVAVYGGFNGTETSIGQRNIAANATTLVASAAGTAVYDIYSPATKTNVFDGFTLKNSFTSTGSGGVSDSNTNDTFTIANCTFANIAITALYITNKSSQVTNCTFTSNGSNYARGGAIASLGGAMSISDCTFTNNEDNVGGGVFNDGGTVNITNCTFKGNIATASGAGVYAGDATIAGCTFTGNTASSNGGGIYNNGGTITVTDCIFTSNTVGSSGYGGGMGAESGTATISGCTFSNNSADYGGGVYERYDNCTIANCEFSGNSATYAAGVYAPYGTCTITDCGFSSDSAPVGGGVYVYGATASTIARCEFSNEAPQAIEMEGSLATSAAPILIKDNLIVGTGTSTSDPDGIDVGIRASGASYITFANNTIVKTSIGINFASNSGAISVANNIFDGNYGGLVHDGAVPVMSSHNDVFGNTNFGYSGASLSATDLTQNPRFDNPSGGNYDIASYSPCVDAGDDSYVDEGDLDVTGAPRIYGSHVDIGAYEYYPAPTITSFTPAGGGVGATVTITGTNFYHVTTIGFTGVHATTFSVNQAATQIAVTVPAGAQTGPIAILAAGGEVKTATNFTVVPPPTITSFSPASGVAGTTVTITGTNLTGTTIVGFQGKHATSFTVNGAGTQITTTVPAGAVTGPIAVLTPGGEAKTTANFMVIAPPTITGFAPASGPVGTTVTITGTNLTGTTVVGFQGKHATSFTVNGTGTQITTTVPAGAATGPVAVLTPSGEAKSVASFTVTP